MQGKKGRRGEERERGRTREKERKGGRRREKEGEGGAWLTRGDERPDRHARVAFEPTGEKDQTDKQHRAVTTTATATATTTTAAATRTCTRSIA